MAQGDFTVFEQFYEDEGEGLHDLENDTIRLGLIDSVITPTAADATPQWGAGSGVDYDGNEVSSVSAQYPTGGLTLANVTYNKVSGDSVLDADNLSMSQDAGNGFTDARWGVLYNDTATNNNAIGFLDLGGATSLQAGDISINWNANGILRKGAGTLT